MLNITLLDLIRIRIKICKMKIVLHLHTYIIKFEIPNHTPFVKTLNLFSSCTLYYYTLYFYYTANIHIPINKYFNFSFQCIIEYFNFSYRSCNINSTIIMVNNAKFYTLHIIYILLLNLINYYITFPNGTFKHCLPNILSYFSIYFFSLIDLNSKVN